jgi:lysophospholipase L1-like esterase
LSQRHTGCSAGEKTAPKQQSSVQKAIAGHYVFVVHDVLQDIPERTRKMLSWGRALNHILVYSDSLTWGIIPDTRRRLPFDERWPGVLENALRESGLRVRITEDCLNGRRTVWEDPFKAGRNGLVGLAQRIESCSPLFLVVLMLGTNDFQFSHPWNDAWSAAQGLARLVGEIRSAPIERGMPVPQILIVCPPPILAPKGAIAPKFAGAEIRCRGFAEACRQLSATLNCHFFDAGSVTPASHVDGIHLDADQHALLGKALAQRVAEILSSALRSELSA